MGAFDWLITPAGVQLTHAVIVLLVAVAAYIGALAKRQSSENAKLLNSHIEQHVMDAASHANENPGDRPKG